MVSTVQPWNCVRMVFWIWSSVATSMAAVASSSTRMRVFRSNARARQINWRWPTLERDITCAVLNVINACKHMIGHWACLLESSMIWCDDKQEANQFPLCCNRHTQNALCYLQTVCAIWCIAQVRITLSMFWDMDYLRSFSTISLISMYFDSEQNDWHSTDDILKIIFV